MKTGAFQLQLLRLRRADGLSNAATRPRQPQPYHRRPDNPRSLVTPRESVLRCSTMLRAASARMPLGAQDCPSEPVVFGDGRVTVGGDVSVTDELLARRRRVRLHATTPASSTTPTTSTRRCACPPRRQRRPCGSAATSRRWRTCAARTRAARDPTALYLRVRPWSTRRLRHPGRPHSADLRRLRAARVRHRQPAHRLSARLSVPDVAASGRAAGERRRPASGCADAAGSRAFRRQPDAGRGASARQTRSAGTPACRCTRAIAVARGGAARSRPARSRNPLFSDDNSGKQIAGRRGCTSGPGPRRRRLGVARAPYVDARRAARGRAARRARLHADGAGAPTSSIRATTIWCGSRQSASAWTSADASSRRLDARATRLVEGRYKLQPRLYVAARARSSRLQHDHRADTHRRPGKRRSRAGRSAAAIRSSATCS